MLKSKTMLGNTVMQAKVEGFLMNVDQLVRSLVSLVDSTTIVDSPMLHFLSRKCRVRVEMELETIKEAIKETIKAIKPLQHSTTTNFTQGWTQVEMELETIKEAIKETIK